MEDILYYISVHVGWPYIGTAQLMYGSYELVMQSNGPHKRKTRYLKGRKIVTCKAIYGQFADTAVNWWVILYGDVYSR